MLRQRDVNNCLVLGRGNRQYGFSWNLCHMHCPKGSLPQQMLELATCHRVMCVYEHVLLRVCEQLYKGAYMLEKESFMDNVEGEF